ncbi:hypothetical protein ARMGADRAFT_439115 [Armillaria gallica]|uniref:Uncharacterized protein n=1 Tax=Armillaria gallica TaxID=47427 RepID=A0A2H3D9B1_ARMGA|nr:hypothetical protein ARMGADRAFT_439115 [Armillaria gallica]
MVRRIAPPSRSFFARQYSSFDTAKDQLSDTKGTEHQNAMRRISFRAERRGGVLHWFEGTVKTVHASTSTASTRIRTCMATLGVRIDMFPECHPLHFACRPSVPTLSDADQRLQWDVTITTDADYDVHSMLPSQRLTTTVDVGRRPRRPRDYDVHSMLPPWRLTMATTTSRQDERWCWEGNGEMRAWVRSGRACGDCSNMG